MQAYGTSIKTAERVRDIFVQGDVRYSDPWSEVAVAGFVDNKAITISKKRLDAISTKSDVRGPQKEMKNVAINVLKRSGYEIEAIECGFMGGIVDVLAKKDNSIVAVECGPCTVRKAIDYLKRDSSALWIIRPNRGLYDLFVIKRGKERGRFIAKHEKYQLGSAKSCIEKAFRF